jgi:hypothetical protein
MTFAAARRWISLVFVLCAVLAARQARGDTPAVADLESGRSYESGTRVRAPVAGISFIIPKEWKGGMPHDSPMLILESDAGQGLGLVLFLMNVTPVDVVARLGEHQDLGEHLSLALDGSIQANGNRLTATYRGGENVGRVMALTGERNAVIYFFAGPLQEAATYDRLLLGLANSTEFTPIDPDPIRRQWQERLTGMMLRTLTSYSSRGGGTDIGTIWNLCRDGKFTYTHVPAAAAEGSASRSSDGEPRERRGQWRIVTTGSDAALLLIDQSGTQTSHTLTADGEDTFVDGERVFRIASPDCP